MCPLTAIDHMHFCSGRPGTCGTPRVRLHTVEGYHCEVTRELKLQAVSSMLMRNSERLSQLRDSPLIPKSAQTASSELYRYIELTIVCPLTAIDHTMHFCSCVEDQGLVVPPEYVYTQ